MKIQEMKSGNVHLNKKVQNIVRENFYVVQPKSGALNLPGESLPPASDLDNLRWSVVSFDKCEAGGLTYDRAESVMSELDSLGVTGLCIVTDEAAKRVRMETSKRVEDS